MKINTIFVFLFLFLSLKLYGNTVHVIVDYTMNKNRLDLIKEKYSDVISKKTDLDIIYIGKGITKEKLGRYEEFKVGCGFDECAEIVDFINEKYFVGDFNYLSKILHAELDFELIDENENQFSFIGSTCWLVATKSPTGSSAYPGSRHHRLQLTRYLQQSHLLLLRNGCWCTDG